MDVIPNIKTIFKLCLGTISTQNVKSFKFVLDFRAVFLVTKRNENQFDENSM